jgi:hypothetical protein
MVSGNGCPRLLRPRCGRVSFSLGKQASFRFGRNIRAAKRATAKIVGIAGTSMSQERQRLCTWKSIALHHLPIPKNRRCGGFYLLWHGF